MATVHAGVQGEDDDHRPTKYEVEAIYFIGINRSAIQEIINVIVTKSFIEEQSSISSLIYYIRFLTNIHRKNIKSLSSLSVIF